MSSLASARPVAVGSSRVLYRRGWVTERYDLRERGVEFSVVLDKLPTGPGDLVVRLRVDTDLEVMGRELGVGNLVFTSPDGGVSIDAVVGIAADGSRSPGVMRYVNDALELVLPQSFVDSAALPLVVDPLITPWIPTGLSPGASVVFSGVAYDATNDNFLVAWHERHPISGDAIIGRLVRSDGTLVGPLLCLECDPVYASSRLHAVANVNSRDGFVVWIEGYFPVTVDAGTGAVRVETSISTTRPAGGLLSNGHLSVSGEATTADDDVLVVRVDRLGQVVVAEEYQFEANGALTLLGAMNLASLQSPQATVRAAKSGGAAGRHMVVWDDSGQIYGAIIDRSFRVLDQGLVRQSAHPKVGPVVGGDGSKWLVTYWAFPPGVDPELKCVPVFWGSNQNLASVGTEVLIQSGPVYFLSPVREVAWMGGSYLINYWNRAMQLGVLDAYTCEPCAPLRQLAGAFELASQRAGDPSGGDLAIIATSGGSVRIYRADDGITTDLGGGCGNGGWADASCAMVGNRHFVFRLREARAGVAAFVALGVQQLGIPCGPCTLAPNPVALVAAGQTDSQGHAGLPLPVPNLPGLVGATFVGQWLTVGGSACQQGLELSNGLRVQLQ